MIDPDSQPIGEERWRWPQEGTFPTEYRFTGQKLVDSAGGIYHMGARFYDPALGRWISADTIIPDPTNPQSLNRYSWVLGNPLRYRDPTGHQGECSWWDVGCWAKLAVSAVREWWNGLNPCSGSVDPLCSTLWGSGFSAPDALETAVNLAEAQGWAGGVDWETVKAAGRWVDNAKAAASWSKEVRDYQRLIAGSSDDHEFLLGGYKFDGIDDEKGVLLDAKRLPENWVNPMTGEFKPFLYDSDSGTKGWITEATNQMGVAKEFGVSIEWHFHSEAAMNAMYYLFHRENPELLEYIKLIWTPEP